MKHSTKKFEKIVITHVPIDTNPEEVWCLAKTDRVLINAICGFSAQLRKESVEVFKRVNNIIATEKGYYFAFFQADTVTVYKPENE